MEDGRLPHLSTESINLRPQTKPQFLIDEMKPSYSIKEAPTRSSNFVSGCLAFQKTMGRLRDQSLTLAEVGKWILVNTTLRICAHENILCPLLQNPLSW